MSPQFLRLLGRVARVVGSRRGRDAVFVACGRCRSPIALDDAARAPRGLCPACADERG